MSDTETDADDTKRLRKADSQTTDNSDMAEDTTPTADGDDTVSYCPFCGAESERRLLEDVPGVYKAHVCTDEACETQFRVEVPYTRTEVAWTKSR